MWFKICARKGFMSIYVRTTMLLLKNHIMFYTIVLKFTFRLQMSDKSRFCTANSLCDWHLIWPDFMDIYCFTCYRARLHSLPELSSLKMHIREYIVVHAILNYNMFVYEIGLCGLNCCRRTGWTICLDVLAWHEPQKQPRLERVVRATAGAVPKCQSYICGASPGPRAVYRELYVRTVCLRWSKFVILRRMLLILFLKDWQMLHLMQPFWN